MVERVFITRRRQSIMPQIRQRILCVDDNADICEMLSTLLGLEGYDVTCASTVEEARQFAAADSFYLFILDRMSPRGTGLELCRELRLQHPHTPVIIYSGDVRERDHKAAAQAGATAYVNKPQIEELVSAVNKLVKERLLVYESNTAGGKDLVNSELKSGDQRWVSVS
jgi:two-component system, OmpR family, response regulator